MTESPTPYPVRVDASLDPRLSRGLWLVKWLLLIPHFFVLAFLWLGFVVVAVIAFFAILVTGRYPRALFDYNLGVLRWSWRVHYYGYGALGTDRYPPFTLADVPDYPARLDIPYPARLSRGLVLVKWWLLAIPHYIVLAVFIGGGAWLGTRGGDGTGAWDTSWGAGGLVGLLVLVAAIVLLFSGRYPQPLYDFVLGMDRWALRVAAYVSLMTDRYPPFRLDMGGSEPGPVPSGPPPAPVRAGSRRGWTAGPVVALISGVVLLFVAAGTLVGGGTLLWADRTQRDAGYLETPVTRLSTDTYAITTANVQLEGEGVDWAVDNVIGTARLEATAADGTTELFVGVARTADAAAYLREVGYTRLNDLTLRWGGDLPVWTTTEHRGGAPALPPTETDIWAASSSGPDQQTLTWRPSTGDWTVVIMRADGTAGLTAVVQAGVTAPGLGWLAAGVLAVGAVLLAAGGLLVALAARRAHSSSSFDRFEPGAPDRVPAPQV